jgi:hypothetical protein
MHNLLEILMFLQSFSFVFANRTNKEEIKTHITMKRKMSTKIKSTLIFYWNIKRRTKCLYVCDGHLGKKSNYGFFNGISPL